MTFDREGANIPAGKMSERSPWTAQSKRAEREGLLAERGRLHTVPRRERVRRVCIDGGFYGLFAMPNAERTPTVRERLSDHVSKRLGGQFSDVSRVLMPTNTFYSH